MNDKMTNSPEEQFFFHLLEKTGQVYLRESETRRKYPHSNWNYSICDTPIHKGKGVFFGLNWGGDDIDKQAKYPEKDQERNWKFITHSRRYLEDFSGDGIEDLNYSNLCFFRSPDMNHFVTSDWDLVIPLFREYVDFINPPWTLMLGKPSPLMSNDRIERFEEHYVLSKSNGRLVKGYTGLLFGKYPFGGLPHPEARISTESRNEIWSLIGQKLNNHG